MRNTKSFNCISDRQRCKPIATGNFIQGWLCNSWDKNTWDKEFRYMNEVGINKLIYSDTANREKHRGPWHIYFDCDIPKLKNNCAEYCPDTLENVLNHARANGVKVFLGTGNYDDWWNYGGGKRFLEFCKDSAKITEEIYSKYYEKYKDCIAGWYFNPEFYNNRFLIYNFKSSVVKSLNILLDKISSLTPDLPIMLSPYFSKFDIFAGVSSHEKFWKYMFTNCHFKKGDIFVPQDCVGSGFTPIEYDEELFQMYRRVVDSTGNKVVLWGNCENFCQQHHREPPYFIKHTEYKTGIPCHIKRFADQLKVASFYCDDIITFSYTHYFSPNVYSPVYHEALKQYVNSPYGDFSSTPSTADIKVEKASKGIKISWTNSDEQTGIASYRLLRNNKLIARFDMTSEGIAHCFLLKNKRNATFTVESFNGWGKSSVSSFHYSK